MCYPLPVRQQHKSTAHGPRFFPFQTVWASRVYSKNSREGEDGERSPVARKLDPAGARAELEDKQYMDSLLEDFLNKGADLRGS